MMKTIKMLYAAILAACLLFSIAAAQERPLASFAAAYQDYTSAERLGLESNEYVCVISKSASIWKEPRTGSEKLGTANYGERLSPADDVTEADGFYQVKYKGETGWINRAYAAYNPLEIVLMESNVPALCAPDSAAKRVGSLSKGTRLQVLGMYGDYYAVSLRQAAAFIPMDAAHYDSWFEAAYSERHASAVTTQETTLRTGPGRDYAKVQILQKGEQITVYGEYRGWYVMRNFTNSDETLMFIERDAVSVWSEWLQER